MKLKLEDIDMNKAGTLYISTEGNVLRFLLGLITHEQALELYEAFNGGTFDNESYIEWLKGLPLEVYGE